MRSASREFCNTEMLAWSCLRHYYPHFAWMLMGQILIHVAVALSALNGNHQTSLWSYVNATIGFRPLALAHLLVAAGLVSGLCWRSVLAQYALLLSVGLYLAQGSLLVAAVLHSCVETTITDLPWDGPVYVLGLVLFSASSYWESVRVRRPSGMC